MEVTLLGAFLAGLLSFLSPCVLPIVPAYLSYISGVSAAELEREQRLINLKVFFSSLLFVVGFSIVFVALGASATFIGNLLQEYQDWIRIVGSGLVEPIRKHVEKGKPFLGICLGLQLLFEKSYEHGEHEGLGILRGEVKLLPPTVRIPHIGWNQLWFKKRGVITEGLKDGDYFYFVHSYRVVPKEEGIILSTTDYGEDFVSSVWVDNLLAVQFHPEKSQKKGLKLLENFKRMAEGLTR